MHVFVIISHLKFPFPQTLNTYTYCFRNLKSMKIIYICLVDLEIPRNSKQSKIYLGIKSNVIQSSMNRKLKKNKFRGRIIRFICSLSQEYREQGLMNKQVRWDGRSYILSHDIIVSSQLFYIVAEVKVSSELSKNDSYIYSLNWRWGTIFISFKVHLSCRVCTYMETQFTHPSQTSLLPHSQP